MTMSINAKELRVGNKILNGTIVEIGNDWFKFDDGSRIWDSREMKAGTCVGLPLSEPLLLACGFKNFPRPDYDARKMIDLFYLRTGYVQITFHMGETWLVAEDTDSAKSGQVILNKSVRSVHQLQNLFFAITGLELNYKQTNQ